MTPVQEAIVRAAREEGIDPATALAIAARESSFNPQARNSKTIRGLFQMRGDLRGKYGVGDSDDPYAQAMGWGRFFKDVKGEMSGTLGRDPTDAEAYAGHHFGGKRASRMMQMDPATPVDAVFTPQEMRLNPHFAKAGTVGNLLADVTTDIDRRRSKFGAEGIDLPDLSEFGTPLQTAQTGPDTGADLPDLSEFGTPLVAEQNQPATSAPAPMSAPDLSQFGTPA